PARLVAKEDDAVSQRLRKYEQLLLVRVLTAQNRHQEAVLLLESLQGQMEVEGRVGMVIEIQVLKALACQAQGDIDRAMAALESALSLAEPEGYVRIFLDEG
ncbi:MAG: helix-turn-helix transcriptional regulator, partial [Anaerolineae bacterium]|nr:helix-turn-helix transcriptional regulator [Anaerolineae bacterium]NIQ81343.1 helix-turn-helix transcriptional regulator [Anaerolineae bacterium]